jgi:hypothetical protein
MSNTKGTVTKIKVNNGKADTTVSKVVELVVKNDQLVPDTKDVDAGVNTRDMYK